MGFFQKPWKPFISSWPFLFLKISCLTGTENRFNLHNIYDSFEIIDGKFPIKQKRLVQAWGELHADELKANWQLAMNEEPVYKINPL